METLTNIILHIVAYIFWGSIFIGLLVFVYNMIRWSIHVANHDFDPFRGWWK